MQRQVDLLNATTADKRVTFLEIAQSLERRGGLVPAAAEEEVLQARHLDIS